MFEGYLYTYTGHPTCALSRESATAFCLNGLSPPHAAPSWRARGLARPTHTLFFMALEPICNLCCFPKSHPAKHEQ